jgi:hypothetical protein
MQRNGKHAARFADRSVRGVADDGNDQAITIWIERREGAVWAVGRAVDLGQRSDGAVRGDDYVFEGFEMGDAIDAANQALRSDLDVSDDEGRPQEVAPFAERELLEPLERWFFGRER